LFVSVAPVYVPSASVVAPVEVLDDEPVDDVVAPLVVGDAAAVTVLAVLVVSDAPTESARWK